MTAIDLEPAPPTTAEILRTSRGRPRRLVRLATAALVAATVAASGYAVDASRSGQPVLGPGLVTIEVAIHHSRFDIGALRVKEGTVLQLVVRNDDPIDHELVIGDAAIHRRHSHGRERRHPPVPGEVSVAPGDTAMTFYEATRPGSVTYACHLPGHAAYGMTGTIEVVPAS
jgi:uncharacterized cupredoxin-like copper-binding protein